MEMFSFFRIRWMRRVQKDANLFKEFFMKRKFIAVFVVMLVLALVTCSSDDTDTDGVIIPEGMVRLTINVDNGTSRALSSAVGSAAAGADFYEVVFHMGSTYYQAEWDKSAGPGTIIVPEGTYADANSAVLFAGRTNGAEKTLLGVGYITSPGGGVIPSGATSVTFTVYSLTNSVSTTAASSTFQITGPTGATGTGYNYATSDSGNDFLPGPIKATTTSSYPVFPVPGPVYTNTGTTAVDVAATYSFTIPTQAGNAVILESACDVSIITGASLGTIDGETPVAGTAAATNVSDTGTVDSPLTGTTTITFKINLASTSGTGGLAGVLIDAPVYALTKTALKNTTPTPPGGTSGSTHIWHIRGGPSLTTAEDGTTTAGNTGAIVLLGVGVHGKGNATLTIPNPGTWN
jgi:hypothetical protein